MSVFAIGFWGAFFGCAVLSFVISLLAFTRSARRVAIRGGVAALMSAAYPLVFLGWIPGIKGESLQRLQALTAIASAAVLALMLFLLLGTFRNSAGSNKTAWGVVLLAAATFASCLFLSPVNGLRVALMAVGLTTVCALAASILSAARGERAGWLALAALPCVSVAMAALNWYAFHPEDTPWQLHAISAVAGIGYLVCIGTAMWTRYAYLLEVSKVMTQGPNYDPVSGLGSYQLGANALSSTVIDGRPVGLLAISISNLKVMEDLHGRAAYNHAIFVCATRLRSLLMAGSELWRLGEDGFVVVTRRPESGQQMIDQARRMLKRLSRPVILGTSWEIRDLEHGGAIWEAALGIGVLLEQSAVSLDVAISGAVGMSRSAWSFPSCMAWYDEARGVIAELPLAD